MEKEIRVKLLLLQYDCTECQLLLCRLVTIDNLLRNFGKVCKIKEIGFSTHKLTISQRILLRYLRICCRHAFGFQGELDTIYFADCVSQQPHCLAFVFISLVDLINIYYLSKLMPKNKSNHQLYTKIPNNYACFSILQTRS